MLEVSTMSAEKKQKTIDTDAAIRAILSRLDTMDSIKAETTAANKGIAGIRTEMRAVNTRIDQIENKLTDMDKNIDQKIEQSIKEVEERLNRKIAANTPTQAPTNSESKDDTFSRARRSILWGPVDVEPHSEEDMSIFARDFLVSKLTFDDVAVDTMITEEITLVIRRRKNAQGEWTDMKLVKITFLMRTDRDNVMAKNPNLRNHPGARMEMDVPDHLIPRQRMLEKAAFTIRKEEKIKTSVRYDDIDRTLKLMTKSPNSPWVMRDIPESN